MNKRLFDKVMEMTVNMEDRILRLAEVSYIEVVGYEEVEANGYDVETFNAIYEEIKTKLSK